MALSLKFFKVARLSQFIFSWYYNFLHYSGLKRKKNHTMLQAILWIEGDTFVLKQVFNIYLSKVYIYIYILLNYPI